MKAIKVHYCLLFFSCFLCLSIFTIEIIQKNIVQSSFDFGYLDYVIPGILLMLVWSLYYSLFKWNRQVNQQKPTDLFWVIISLGVILTTFGVFNIVEGIADVFPGKKENSFLGSLFDLLFGVEKTQQQTDVEKISLCFYISYTLLLVAILLLTIYIRIKLTNSVANAR